ncbi:hypothetical protein ACTXT7_008784 [Hymenolepis weldensis]
MLAQASCQFLSRIHGWLSYNKFVKAILDFRMNMHSLAMSSKSARDTYGLSISREMLNNHVKRVQDYEKGLLLLIGLINLRLRNKPKGGGILRARSSVQDFTLKFSERMCSFKINDVKFYKAYLLPNSKLEICHGANFNALGGSLITKGEGFQSQHLERNRLYMHEKLSELLGVHIQSVVEFAKNLPHFSSLSQPDQLALLKGSFPEVWIVQSARFITFNDFKMTMYNGAAVKREELEFVYGPPVMEAAFQFAADFCRLHLNEVEIALFCAVLLTKPDRLGVTDVEKAKSVNQQYLALLRYQIEGRPEAAFVLESLSALTSRLAAFSDMMRKVMAWFRKWWHTTKLSPLHAEIYDIPQNQNHTLAPLYPNFQSSTYIPAPASELYSNNNSAYYPLKEEQSHLPYQQYTSQPDYSGMYSNGAQGTYYSTPVEHYTDPAMHSQQIQQFMYLNGVQQERWHTSAFEPYSTDMATNGKPYSQESQQGAAVHNTEVARADRVSSGAYQEETNQARSLGSTESPGAIQGDAIQSVAKTSEGRNVVQQIGDNPIVSGDDPFAIYQNARIPVISGSSNNNGTGQDQLWNNQEGDKNDTKREMPTLTPAPELMASMEQGSSQREPELKQEVEDTDDVGKSNVKTPHLAPYFTHPL